MMHKCNSIGLAAMVGAAAVFLPHDVDSSMHIRVDGGGQQTVEDSPMRGVLRLVHMKLQEELGQTHRELCKVPDSGLYQVDDLDTLVAIDGCLQKVERAMNRVPMQDSKLDTALRDRMATECHLESDSWQNAMREALSKADVVPQKVEEIDVVTPQDAMAKTRMEVTERLGRLQAVCALNVTADLVNRGVEERIQNLKEEINL